MIPESTRKALLTRKNRPKAIINARKAGATLQEIGDVLGLSRERVRQLESYGPKWKPKVQSGPHKKTLERDKKIAKYYNDGITIKEIAETLDVTPATIKRRVQYLRRRGVVRYRIKVKRRKKKK